MARIERKKGAFHDLEFEMDLSKYGKTFSDIAEITFSIKKNISDLDNSLFLKKLSLGEITASGDTIVSVSVQWGTADYNQFNFKTVYKAALFATFTGDPVADENVDKIFELKIIEDFLDS